MQIISPVLAGSYNTAAYQPAATNINAAANAANAANTTAAASASGAQATDFTTTIGSSATSSADPRRYSKFDHSASNVADAPDFSFGDLVDMVNPLQHIPVVSSVYRAATGETINPVSRVAGDIMYGGALGAVSAMVSGAGAVGDAVAESETGSDKIGNVFAGLFGGGKDQAQPTQLASADPTNAAAATAVPSLLAAPATPVTASTLAATATTTTPSSNLPSLLAAQQIASNSAAPASTAAASASANSSAAAPAIGGNGKVFPLTAANRMPFGGVMDTGNNIEAQNAAIALADGSHAMRIGHTIYTSRLMNGPHPLPIASMSSTPATTTPSTTAATTSPTAPAQVNPAVAAAINEANAASVAAITGAAPAAVTATAATPSVAAASASSAATSANAAASSIMSAGMSPNPTQSLSPSTLAAGHNPLPQNLVDDMVMMRALGQYKGIASGTPGLGATVDMRN